MQIHDLLARSAASNAFRAAVEAFLRGGRPNSAIVFSHAAPPIKVERTLAKLLETYAELPIERVVVDAVSGCDHFRGSARVEAGERQLVIEFEWNCRWKAEQLGWVDWFGLPDQSRAAREFGYDCFRAWEELELAA